MDSITMVEEFHKVFGCYTAPKPGAPELHNTTRSQLMKLSLMIALGSQEAFIQAEKWPMGATQAMFTRAQLISEELAELLEAIANQDTVEILDALADLQYVLDGTWLALGMGELKGPAMAEVHRSNMTKLVDGKPIVNEAGRVVKPEGWEPPKLADLLERMQN